MTNQLSRRSFLGALSGLMAMLGVKPRPLATSPDKPIDAQRRFLCGEIELRPVYTGIGVGYYQAFAIAAINIDGEQIEPGTPVYFEDDGTVTTRTA